MRSPVVGPEVLTPAATSGGDAVADHDARAAHTALRALARAEQRWRMTMDSSPLGMALLSVEGRFLRVNRALCALLGRDAESLRALASSDVVHPDDAAVAAVESARCLTGEQESSRLLQRWRHAAGHHVWVEVTAAVVREDDGTPIHVVAHVEDVSAQMQDRARLEHLLGELATRTTELERSNQDLEQVAAVASHDLRGPLTVLTGWLEILDHEYAGSLGPRGRELLRRADQASGRMMDLLDALLRHARVGGHVVERQHVALDDVLDQVVVDLGDTAARGLVRRDLAAPTVRADPALLRQLLQNLLGNAVKFRSPDRAPRVVVTSAVTPQGHELAVVDNGRGIAASQRARVLDMFGRDDSDPDHGHGIGLATCARIASLHGGRLLVEDTPGGGTTVRMTLPS
ncbi:sensor histidine kinase [Nocardioides sp. Leaf285]|uniref:sensor histidine kinase n=1 Tax=Nocardioides sp. Leaf285 TaxID=1736322 RepID=UPI0007033A51|nr:ATP-binding protein [Nocardioides sp. Leaf285]KQP64603.1 hypothetical protein ASF47_11705 [Nocardioides sp. Leaf285]